MNMKAKNAVKRVKRSEFLMFIIAGLLPLTILGYLIGRNSVNVPHWDEWEFIIPVFQKIAAGEPISFRLLWADSGDHVVFVPRLIILILGGFSSLNFSVLHWTNLFFVLLTFLILLKAVGKETQFNVIQKLLLVIVVSVVHFSLETPGVYLWGMSLYIYISLFFFTLCSWFLSLSNMPLGLALVHLASNAIVLLTSTNGLAVAALSVVIGFFKSRETKSTSWKIVSIGSLFQLILMIAILSQRKLGININLFGHGPIEFLKYVLVYLGSNFDLNDVSGALLHGAFIGMFSIGILIYIGHRFSRTGCITLTETEQFFLYVGLLAIATAFLTAVGREGPYGVRQALSDRYIPFAHLLVVSLIYTWARVTFAKLNFRRVSHGLFFNCLPGNISRTIVFIIPLFYPILNSLNTTNIKSFGLYRSERESARLALLRSPNLSSEERKSLEAIYPGGYEPMRERIEFMKTARLGPFSNYNP